jgi:chromosomal replication initiation ATPase DnaA
LILQRITFQDNVCLIDEEPSLSNDQRIFARELGTLKDFLDKPRSQITRKIVFLHGSAGNGTTFLVHSIARQYSSEYSVAIVAGSVYNAMPSCDQLEGIREEIKSKPRSLLIIDDADKLLIDYLSSSNPAWHKQRETLINLLGTLQSSDKDVRIILTSNESSLLIEDIERKGSQGYKMLDF